MVKRYLALLFLLSSGLKSPLKAQFFLISPVYRPVDDTLAVFSILIRNTARDSIFVLHSQETEAPPFINNYRVSVVDSESITVYMGKSTNPLIPETYRSSKTIKSRNKMEIYFSIPKSCVKLKKYVDIWYVLVDQQYFKDFQKHERVDNNTTLEHVRKLKAKYGTVYHRVLNY